MFRSMSTEDAIPMVKKIIYATDLGIYGPYLLEHVSDLAERHKAKVVVVHAIEPLSPFADAVLEAFVPEDEKKTLKMEGIENVLDTIRLRVMSAFEDDFIDYDGGREWLEDVLVVAGKAPEVILQQAREQNADLIVIGSHGNGQHSNYTSIGSVASKVLQLSEVPVYLVPTQTKRISNLAQF